MPELLTRSATKWPASNRNGGRLQIGTPAGFVSEYPAGLRRNLQAVQRAPYMPLETIAAIGDDPTRSLPIKQS
ncbi:MAG: hypothetical protein ACLFTG_01205 [Alphaproteobacteria bacterium]